MNKPMRGLWGVEKQSEHLNPLSSSPHAHHSTNSANATLKSQHKALKLQHSFVRITATSHCCTKNGFQHKPEVRQVRHSLWSSFAQGWVCPMDLGCCRGAWMDIYNPGLNLHRAHCRIQTSVPMMGIQTHRKICYPPKATFCMPWYLWQQATQADPISTIKQTWSEKPNSNIQDFPPTLHSARPRKTSGCHIHHWERLRTPEHSGSHISIFRIKFLIFSVL